MFDAYGIFHLPKSDPCEFLADASLQTMVAYAIKVGWCKGTKKFWNGQENGGESRFWS
jgi:hypothetical protein